MPNQRNKPLPRWLIAFGAIVVAAAVVGLSEAPARAAEAVAFPGSPFGVGRVTIPVSAGAETALLTNGFDIRDAEGRIFYPAFRTGRAGELLSGLLGSRRPIVTGSLNVWFLFRGDAPLDVTIHTPEPQRFQVIPVASRDRGYERLLAQWHEQYNAAAASEADSDAGSRFIEIYLTAMLSQRLGLAPPALTAPADDGSDGAELRQTLELIAGTERLRDDLLRQTMQGNAAPPEPARYAPPEPIAWTELEFADLPPDVAIEPIALHVPVECFYVRFGDFRNYLWLSDLAEEHGGDLGRMVTLRARDAQLSQRIERQLALKKTALAEILGPQVISDVAIIGRDLYLQEGAALGMLFEASNGLALGADIQQKRQAALRAFSEQGATLETVQIAGRDVSLLSTPDNQLRSFYAVDGKYHLVTTSREIVARFFEAGGGEGSLGQSPEFQNARRLLPLSRQDAVTAYFSTAFLHGLLSPQYQIELQRRLQAAIDIELIQLAQLAARSEGVPGETIEDLIAAGLLPAGLGLRSDGSGPIVATSGIIDSRRGPRGHFTPIPDVPLEAVTAAEAQRFARRAAYYQQRWQRMDPLMIGVQRTALETLGRERLVIDANVAPLVADKYGWVLSLIGPPTEVQIEGSPTEIVSLQASLSGGSLAPDVPPHQLFLGIEDTAPAVGGQPDGVLEWIRLLRTTPGYLGSWPKIGFLDRLPLRAGRRSLRGPDAAGYSQLPLGLWRWEQNGFSLLSFQRDVLERAANTARVVPAPDPAQIRGHVGDLSESQLGGWLSRLEYERAWRASLGNIRLLNTLTQQFHVPRPDALSTAESLLDTNLVCTLGGEYQLVETGNGDSVWRSNFDEDGSSPADYAAPLLQWFRGADFELTKQDDQLLIHAEVELQRRQEAAGNSRSLLDLFSLPPRAPTPAP